MAHYDMTAAQATEHLQHRKNRSRNLSHEERVAIGVEAHFATAKSVAEKWGIAPITVTSIKTGAIQTAEQRETGKDGKAQIAIHEIVQEKRERILKRSTAKLMMALKTITKEKLEESGVRVAAGVARDMAIVADKMATLGESKNGTNVAALFQINPPAIMTEAELGAVIEVPIEKE